MTPQLQLGLALAFVLLLIGGYVWYLGRRLDALEAERSPRDRGEPDDAPEPDP